MAEAFRVTGIEFVTTAILIITCIAIIAVIPVASKLPNMSGARIAISMPLHMNITNNNITTTQPTKPNSSASTEKMKSLCGNGKYKYFCLLFPKSCSEQAPRTYGIQALDYLPSIS